MKERTNTTTTTNKTINEKANKMLEKALATKETAKTDNKKETKTDSKKDNKTDAPKTETKKDNKTETKKDAPKEKVYKDAKINNDKVDKKVVTAINKDVTELKKALAQLIKDDKTITINIDYKKAKITVKKANKLIARINKRKTDFYLRTYKDSKETIAKNQSLDNCTKAIEKLLK